MSSYITKLFLVKILFWSQLALANLSDNFLIFTRNLKIITSHAVMLPPINFQGYATQNYFLIQTDLINVLSWGAPTGGTAPVNYKIYRDASLTQLVATVPASGTLQYEDHNRQPNTMYTYYLVSIDGSGNVSAPVSVVVTT